MSPTNPPSKQTTVIITFVVAPESVEEFKNAHRPVWTACSKEPQCLFFDIFRDMSNPGRIRFVEVWSESKEWFLNTQMNKPYYADLPKKSKPLWLEEPVMEFFEREGEGCIFRKGYLDGGRLMDG